MKIVFYDTKPYDKIWFEPMAKEAGEEITFLESKLNRYSVEMAKGYDAICIFVNDDCNREVIEKLADYGIKLILLRCSGYNNVDFKAAQGRITVLRVSRYSPYSIAEHAMAMALCVNRKIHRAFIRTKDFNFNINGLMGFDFHGRTAGIIGTGKIGEIMAHICKGFGMRVLAYDKYQNPNLDVEYTELDDLFARSDLISLHCPLTKETKHMINRQSIAKMKEGAILVNTSRGALIHTGDLIEEGLRSKKLYGVALDVYEEEDDYFFEDRSNEIVEHEDLALLTTFPNVLLTSHQAFFTKEAMEAIAKVTFANIEAYEKGEELVNEVAYKQQG